MNKVLDCSPSRLLKPESTTTTQGLIMVKPHALKQGLDHVIDSILRGDGSCYTDELVYCQAPNILNTPYILIRA